MNASVTFAVIVVEHQGTGEDPTLLMGFDAHALRRQLVEVLTDCRMADFDDAEFRAENPMPTADSSDDDVLDWLEAYREATTAPWFTEYAPRLDIAFGASATSKDGVTPIWLGRLP